MMKENHLPRGASPLSAETKKALSRVMTPPPPEEKGKTAARTLSCEEMKALPDGTVVWKEYVEDDHQCDHLWPAMIDHMWLVNRDGIAAISDSLMEYFQDGYRMRYWTRKPTDEEREKTPWP